VPRRPHEPHLQPRGGLLTRRTAASEAPRGDEDFDLVCTGGASTVLPA
jgi:hypothetical protein